MTKIIFLDFDGVLLTDQDAQDQSDNNGLTRDNYLEKVVFNQDCINNLNALLLASDAEIVLSTSWALGHSISDLSHCLMRNGIDPGRLFEYDDPGDRGYMTPRKMSSGRSTEIGWWLEEHPEIERWVAIDDDASILHLKTNIVRTNPRLGFDRAALSRATSILAG